MSDKVERCNHPRTKRPFEITRHGDVRIDPYYWLMNRDDPRSPPCSTPKRYLDSSLEPLGRSRRDLREIKDRIEETNISVPVRRGPWWYFERTREV